MLPTPGGSPLPRAKSTSTSGHGSADAAGAGGPSSAEATSTAPAPTTSTIRRTRLLIKSKTSIFTEPLRIIGPLYLVFDANRGRDCPRPRFSTARHAPGLWGWLFPECVLHVLAGILQAGFGLF